MRSGTSFSCLAMMSAIMAAPLLFGAVHPWAFHSLYAFVFLLLILRPKAWSHLQALPSFSRLSLYLTGVWLCLQTLFWAADRHAAVNGLCGWLALTAVFLLIQDFNRSEIYHLLGALLAAAFAAASYGLWQLSEPVEMVLWRIKETHESYLTGTYLNRNHFAGLLEMALGISGGWWLAVSVKRRRLQQVLFAGLFLFLFWALLRTGSRLGLLAFGLSALPVFVWALRRQASLRRSLGVLAIILLLIAVSQAYVLAGRFRWEDGYLTAQTGRLWAWQDALSLLKDYAWNGTGLGGFSRVFPQYQSERLLMGWAHAHQDYLEIAIELGLPVFLIWAAGWIVFFKHGCRALDADSGEHFMAAGLLSGLSALMLHGLADFNFSIPANAFIWIVLASSLYRFRCPDKESAA